MPRRSFALTIATAAALATGALAGCSSDGGISWQGTAGTPTPAGFPAWVPVIDGAFDGVHGRFLIDTGAPMVMADRDRFGGIWTGDGPTRVTLGAFGLAFPDLEVAVFDLFPDSATGSSIDAIIGGDLLRHFALTLDYAGRMLLLDDAPVADDTVLPSAIDPSALAPVEAVGFALRGGGIGQIPGPCPGGCGGIEVGATRVLVEVSLEGGPPVWMLVDSGASNVLLAGDIADGLPAGARPHLAGVTVGTASGPATAYLTRVGGITLGADRAGGADSVPALVLEDGADDAIWADLRAETGVEVRGLLGGSFLRRFAIRIDYGTATLALGRYLDPAHIDPEEYVRVGFTVVATPGATGTGWAVGDLYPGTSAAAAGLRAGEAIERLGGVPIGGADRATVDARLAGALGDTILVGVRRDGQPVDLPVVIEDLLPPFATPAGREDAP